MKTRDKLIEMYLDYFNNFLSILGFSEHYGITPEEGRIILTAGRELHEAQIRELNEEKI